MAKGSGCSECGSPLVPGPRRDGWEGRGKTSYGGTVQAINVPEMLVLLTASALAFLGIFSGCFLASGPYSLQKSAAEQPSYRACCIDG